MVKQHSRSGFSLVELSIVLVILGLLVGGVMAGQNLIKAAEMRSVTTEFEQWQIALNLFKGKYNAIPGDMRNATAFWNDEGNCTAVAANTHTAALAGGTCNGTGSGKVTNNSSLAQSYEFFLFWHHLQLAGMIPGQYTGVHGDGGPRHHVIGENAPRARFNNGGWSAWAFNAGNAALFELDYGNGLVIGAQHHNTIARALLFTPEEAWNIDSKIDDGKPGQGNVIAIYWDDACADATSNTDYAADYRLNDNTAQCALFFRNAF